MPFSLFLQVFELFYRVPFYLSTLHRKCNAVPDELLGKFTVTKAIQMELFIVRIFFRYSTLVIIICMKKEIKVLLLFCNIFLKSFIGYRIEPLIEFNQISL